MSRKMDDKLVIWLMGGFASGKTTQNKRLIEYFAGDQPMEYVKGTNAKGINYFYTKFGNLASLGKVKGSNCCGLDSVFGSLGVKGFELTLKMALEDCQIVIIEGAQASPTWEKIVTRLCPKYFLFHLHLSFDDNMDRMRLRHKKKKGLDIPVHEVRLEDKMVKNIIGKNNQYQSMFEKVKDTVPHLVRIDARLSEKKVFREIIKYVNQHY